MDNVDVAANTLLSSNEIAIIDLSLTGTASNDKTQWTDDAVKQLHTALSTNGAAFLVNHGIPQEKFTNANNIMKSFCGLPNEIKDQYKKNSNKEMHGYIAPGNEVICKAQGTDFKHSYDIGNTSGKLPTKEISNFREVVRDVAEKLFSLSTLILKMIAEALEVDQERFLGIHNMTMDHNNTISFLRMVYYPPVGEEPVPDVTRCGAHTDWGTFALISEDTEGGFEIFQKGEWRRVGHLPGALLMIVGEILEVWTSSKYKALRHRVVIPKDVDDRTKGRSSVIFFADGQKNTLVHPSVLSPNQSETYWQGSSRPGAEKTLTYLEYIQKKQNKNVKIE